MFNPKQEIVENLESGLQQYPGIAFECLKTVVQSIDKNREAQAKNLNNNLFEGCINLFMCLYEVYKTGNKKTQKQIVKFLDNQYIERLFPLLGMDKKRRSPLEKEIHVWYIETFQQEIDPKSSPPPHINNAEVSSK